MNKVTNSFIKSNALLSAKKILALDKQLDLPEPLLTLAWEVLYDLKGFARPVDSWIPAQWRV